MKKYLLFTILAAFVFAGCEKEKNESLPGTWEYQSGTMELFSSWPAPHDTIIALGDSPDIKKVVFQEDGTAVIWRWDGAETLGKNYETRTYAWRLNATKDTIQLTSPELGDMQWRINSLTRRKLEVSFTFYYFGPEAGSSTRFNYLFQKTDSK
jgi:hypothetical protein